MDSAIHMPRRWSALLVIWFGLLVGVASPALACATQATGGDCCPQGPTSPCPDRPGRDSVALAVCCVNVPPAPSAVTAEVTRNKLDQLHDSGSPDPIVALTWFATFFPNVRAPPAAPSAIYLPRTSATLIWLRTGRLRL